MRFLHGLARATSHCHRWPCTCRECKPMRPESTRVGHTFLLPTQIVQVDLVEMWLIVPVSYAVFRRYAEEASDGVDAAPC